MSALDSLSTAANVLQIIGFADTVFRTGKSLYELFNNARSASKNIALLLLELQALLSVVTFVRVVTIEHASSPFAREDGQALPNIHTILTLIDQDFRHLRELLGQTVRSGRDGWLSLLQSNLRWALKDDEITASRHRLSRYTQSLTAALSVSGRRNDIVLRSKIQSIEEKLQAITQCTPVSPLQLKLDMPPPSSRPAFTISRRQTRAARSRIQPRSSRQDSLVPTETFLSPLNGRRNESIIPDSEKSQGLGFTFHSHRIPKVNVYQLLDGTLVLETGNYSLHEITKPLTLVRDPLTEALNAICTNPNLSIRISKTQLEHLQMLFDFLAASSHIALADNIAGKYRKGTKSNLPDGDFLRGKSKDKTAKKRGPTYMEEVLMRLDTIVGSMTAKLLSAQSHVGSTTMAFDFKFQGDNKPGLSAPFAVQFLSQDLTSSFRQDTGINVPGLAISLWKGPWDRLGSGYSSTGLLDFLQCFLSPIMATVHDQVQLALFVSQQVHQWYDTEITTYVTCGPALPRIPVRVHEFVPKTPGHLQEFRVQYATNPVILNRVATKRRIPPLGMLQISLTEDKKYFAYVDDIVNNHLVSFGELCWMEDDNDFNHRLFQLITRVRPRSEDEVKIMRDVYRLIVVTFIMGHIITIADESKHSTIRQMRSFTSEETYDEFLFSRVTNRQLKFIFYRIQTSVIISLLTRLQQVFANSKGYNKWIIALIGILGLAMSSEDQEKYICLVAKGQGMGEIDERACVACHNLEAQFNLIQQVFQWKYNNNRNPLRDSEFFWEQEVGFDEDSVKFVRGVSSLVRDEGRFYLPFNVFSRDHDLLTIA